MNKLDVRSQGMKEKEKFFHEQDSECIRYKG